MEINLLPWRTDEILQKNFYCKLQLAVCLVSGVLIWLLWHIILQQKITVSLRQERYLQSQQERSTKQRQKDGQPERTQLWQQAVEQNRELEQQRRRFVDFFASMQQFLPDNSYCDHLSIDGDAIKLTGQIKTMADLRNFINKFAADKKFVVPSIQKLARRNDGYEFVLSWLDKKSEQD